MYPRQSPGYGQPGGRSVNTEGTDHDATGLVNDVNGASCSVHCKDEVMFVAEGRRAEYDRKSLFLFFFQLCASVDR